MACNKLLINDRPNSKPNKPLYWCSSNVIQILLIRFKTNQYCKGMDFSQLNRLIANSTYSELGLRAKEYLRYLNTDGEEKHLAETIMYNCMVNLLKDLGMEQRQAEEYCDNADNLTELAQYISSILG